MSEEACDDDYNRDEDYTRGEEYSRDETYTPDVDEESQLVKLPLTQTTFTNRDLDVTGVAPVLAAFSLFSARIFLIPLWTSFYLPVVSPIYWQGHVWASEHRLSVAIIMHVACGIVTLLSAIFQLDKRIRHTHPAVHRWTGRLYVAAGTGMIASLYELRRVVGRGHSQEPDVAMQHFIDASVIVWCGSTAVAVLAMTVTRRPQVHARCMTVSLSVACVPIMQRVILLAVVVPALACLRLCQDAWHGVSFFEAKWDHTEPSGWTMPWTPLYTPVVSIQGYGVLEHIGFPISAWTGLLLMVVAPLMIPQTTIQNTKLDGLFSWYTRDSQMRIDDGIHTARQAATDAYAQWGFSRGPQCFRVLVNMLLCFLPAVFILALGIASMVLIGCMLPMAFIFVSGFLLLWAFIPSVLFSSMIYVAALAKQVLI